MNLIAIIAIIILKETKRIYDATKRIYLYVPFKDKEIEYFNYYKYTKKGLKMKNTIKLALLSVVTACVFLLALQSQKSM
ncbi:hypothetical protein B6794_005145 [Campylobacter jejuni]